MDDTAQTAVNCKHKHRGINRLLGFTFTVMGLIVVLVGWAIADSRRASSKAVAASRVVDIHIERQTVVDENIAATLRRLEANIDKQRGMIEDLWKRNGG